MEQSLIISSVLLWVLTLFNLILTLALIRQSKSRTAPDKIGLRLGEKAPDFVSETLEGKQVTLSEYRGRSAAFIFISADCVSCRESLPSYEALRPKAFRAGTELVLVSTSSKEATRSLVTEFQLKCQILVAPHTSSFMEDYKMRGTPSYTLIDAQGRIQAAGRPLSQMPDWKELTGMWEEPPTRPELATTAPYEGR